MAQVSQSTPDQVILAQGSTTIGRAKDNTMVLPFKTISSYHAKIMTFGDSAYIQDLGSTNGVFVNGKPKQFQVLHHGDSVNIGEYQFMIAGFEKRDPKPAPEFLDRTGPNQYNAASFGKRESTSRVTS